MPLSLLAEIRRLVERSVRTPAYAALAALTVAAGVIGSLVLSPVSPLSAYARPTHTAPAQLSTPKLFASRAARVTNEAVLRWTRSAGAPSYKIFEIFTTGGKTTTRKIARVSSRSNSFLVGSLSLKSPQWCFAVQAVGHGIASPYSSEACVKNRTFTTPRPAIAAAHHVAPRRTLPPTTTATTQSPPVQPVPEISSLAPGGQFISGSFRTLLPAGASLLSTSASLVQNFVTAYQTHYSSVGDVNDYPIVTVPAGQALVPIAPTAGCSNFTSNTGTQIPIPATAAGLLTGSSDNPLILWQPSTGTEWEFWQAHYGSGKWSACWGGKISNLSTSSGVFTNPYGLAASGISYLATTITEADIASGAIDHAIALQMPVCSAPAIAPANRTDCGSQPGMPQYGMRFRLPSNLAMPAGLTPYARIVFKALQNYGAVFTDYSGAVMLASEWPADWAAEGHAGTDPITTSWAGQPEYSVLKGIPWQDMTVVTP